MNLAVIATCHRRCGNMPDVDWLIETLRRLRRDGDGGMARRAYDAVRNTHSYEARCRAMLEYL